MMKKTFVPLIGAIALLASCAENDMVDKGFAPSSDLISFSTYMGPSSRATAVETLDSLKTKNFKVFAAYTGGNAWADATDKTPNFMYNDPVTWDATAVSGTGAWTYAGAKYWPQSGNVTFYAYSPNLSTHVEHSLATAATAPSFVYTVPDLVNAQEDLLADIAADKTKADGTVHFTFDHLLSKIGFAAKLNAAYAGAAVEVTKLKITYKASTIQNKATYTYADTNTEASIWSDFDATTFMAGDNELQPTAGVTLGTTLAPLNSSDKFLMLLPQTTVSSALQARIEYTVSYAADGVETQNVATVDLPACTWLPGKQYTYNFNISLNAVTFGDITVNPWDDAQTVDMKDAEGKIIAAGSETSALFTGAAGSADNQKSYTTAANAEFVSVKNSIGNDLQYFTCTYDGMARTANKSLVFAPKQENTNPATIEEIAVITFKDVLGNIQVYTFKLRQSGKLATSFGGNEIANNAELLFNSIGNAYSCGGTTAGISGQTITLNVSGATSISVTGNSSFTCTPAGDNSSISITAPAGTLVVGADDVRESSVTITLTGEESSNTKTYNIKLRKCAPAALKVNNIIVPAGEVPFIGFKSTGAPADGTATSGALVNTVNTNGSTFTGNSEFSVTTSDNSIVITALGNLTAAGNYDRTLSGNLVLANACGETTTYNMSAKQYAAAYITEQNSSSAYNPNTNYKVRYDGGNDKSFDIKNGTYQSSSLTGYIAGKASDGKVRVEIQPYGNNTGFKIHGQAGYLAAGDGTCVVKIKNEVNEEYEFTIKVEIYTW